MFGHYRIELRLNGLPPSPVANGKSDPPPAPDYRAAAEAQGQNNVETARLTAKLNRPAEYTPLGSRTWANGQNFDQPGYDAALATYRKSLADWEAGGGQTTRQVLRSGSGGYNEGGPQDQWVTETVGLPKPLEPDRADFMTGDPDSWVSHINLTPEGQQRFDTERGDDALLGGLGEQGLDRVRASFAQPFSAANADALQAKTEGLVMDRLRPQFDREEEQMRSRLYASGIREGSEAWNDENRRFGEREDSATREAILAAMGQRPRVLQEELALRTQPLNEVNALRTGSQVQLPQFQAWQGANVAPAPIFQGAQAQGQADIARYNAQAAGDAGFMGGLFSLGSAALQNPALMASFSDRRLKSRIVRVGTHRLGIGLYEYDIFGRRERGVMADEVAAVLPEAVLTHPSGYLMVDYGRL